MESEKGATNASQVSGTQSGADVLKILLAVRRTKWTIISKRPGFFKQLQGLIILLRGRKIAGLKILLQLSEVGPALIKEALQFAVDRV